MSFQLYIPCTRLVPVFFTDPVTVQDPLVWEEAFNEYNTPLKYISEMPPISS